MSRGVHAPTKTDALDRFGQPNVYTTLHPRALPAEQLKHMARVRQTGQPYRHRSQILESVSRLHRRFMLTNNFSHLQQRRTQGQLNPRI
eukprot:1160440-Pelagomonas_calceolata.AAC.4